MIVQIVGEGNAVSVAGAAALRLVRYGQHFYSQAPQEPGNAGQPGWTASGRRETRILFPYNQTSLPFQGREALLQDLKDWLADGAQRSVHALIGGGGRGKTRLAVELAAWAREHGWTAGFVRRDELDLFRRTGCRTEWNGPCLVIVDYAAAKAAMIGTWLRALVNHAADDRPPLRLLLLERTGGDGIAWWRGIFGGAGPEGEAVRDLLAPGAPAALGVLSTPTERHAVFAAAFGQACDQPVPPQSAVLDHALARASLGGEPLFLAMFGLVAARQGLGAAQAMDADRIALDLAAQELERIGRIWSAYGLPMSAERPLHAHLAAVATLSEGLSEAEAHATIARESIALHQAILDSQTEAARAAVHAALPGEDGGIAPILPDVLGEAAAIQAFGTLSDSGIASVGRAAAAKRREVTGAVIRSCQDFLIRGERRPLAWLKALQAEAADLGALLELADAMPPDTIELREIALELSEEVLRRCGEVTGDAGAALRAAAFNNFSNRLSALGRREDALAAIKEGVKIRRALAATHPNLRPELGTSLSNLSNRLSDLGSREEALAVAEEAVKILRTLAAGQPGVLWAELAMSLNNLSNRLSDLGRPEAALSAIEKAIELRRALAAARPADFLPELSGSLNNLANRLSALGRRQEALGAVQEAIAIRRALAAVRPDAFRPDLATSLNNLSVHLSRLGRHEGALAAVEEAVEIRRNLAAARPAAFLPELASSLNNLSNRLGDLDRAEAALAAATEAVAIRRDLAAARPAVFRPVLASSLNNLSNCLSDLNRGEAARAAVEEAVEICRALAAAQVEAFLPDLAMVLNNLSNRLLDTGHQEAALSAVEEAVEHYRMLAAARPDAFRPDLAGSLNNLSVCLARLGYGEEALASSREAADIFRDLSSAWPDAFTDRFTISLRALAERCEETGDTAGALAANLEAIDALYLASQHSTVDVAEKIAAIATEYIARCQRFGVTPEQELFGPIATAMPQSAGLERNIKPPAEREPRRTLRTYSCDI